MAGIKYFDITDTISLTDEYGIQRVFQATIGFAEGRRMPTIQSGRIAFFIMTDGLNEIVCLYEDGKWKKDVDIFEDPLSDLARTAFLGKWNGGNRHGTKHRARSRISASAGVQTQA